MSNKLKDIFNLNLDKRGGVKQFNNIINKYIINKKEKKELFKEVKNINKEKDSFDDGMEYYRFNAEILADSGFPNDCLANFIITSIVNGKLHLGLLIGDDGVGYFCGNTKLMVENTTAKDWVNTKLEEYGTSLNDTTIFQPITAKEYYSLLD